jgi:hypothetical protein
LRPRKDAWDEIGFVHGEVTTISVPVTSIDAVVHEQTIDDVFLVKIDVQGFELEVLKGAENSLDRIKYIFVESAIRQLYAGAPRFSDVFDFLTARDFHLMAMRSWHRGNHVLVETDMLFRRNDLAGPIDPSISRIYEQNG